MPMNQNSKRREKGMVTLLTAIMLIFLILPVVGLAIDAGVAYTVKAKLQTAVDGAAIAAARSLGRGTDAATQLTEATDTANRFYHGNFPVGWMGVATVDDPTTAVTYPADAPKTTRVTISGSVPVPAYFMRVVGWNTLTVTASGQVSRRDVNIILVIDRSGSLADSGSCTAVRNAASSFVSSFVSGRDKVGMITFGTDYRVDYAPNVNFGTTVPSLATTLSSLVCYGYTNSAAAFWAGYQQIVTMNDTQALNVILFFTDGQPNTLTFGVAPDGTDNRLSIKTQATPAAAFAAPNNWAPPWGFGDIRAASPCAVPGTARFTGVVSFIGGIYKRDAPAYPASQARDAQKITATEGDVGTCLFDTQFNNAGTIYRDQTNTFAIAGPGYPAIFDIPFLPDQDINGNLTGNGFVGSPLVAVNTYPAVPAWPAAGSWPVAYVGRIRVDDMVPTAKGGYRGCCLTAGAGCTCVIGVNDNITNAGINALDNAAQRARSDAATRNLALITYSIGLGNTPGGVSNSLLARVANDPSANNYNTAYLEGIYAYSPDASQLQQAFTRIAADVLRITK